MTQQDRSSHTMPQEQQGAGGSDFQGHKATYVSYDEYPRSFGTSDFPRGSVSQESTKKQFMAYYHACDEQSRDEIKKRFKKREQEVSLEPYKELLSMRPAPQVTSNGTTKSYMRFCEQHGYWDPLKWSR
jgi:hypothetical protein